MKTITLLLIFCISIVVNSQTVNDSSYSVNQKEILSYLDSITNSYSSKLSRPHLNLDLSTPIKSTRKWYTYVFGDSVNIRSEPNTESNIITTLKFGDIILIPMFNGKNGNDGLSFHESRYLSFFFCITKDGKYGFISTGDFTHNKSYIKPLPGTDYLFIRHPRKAIVKNDYSKFKIFGASNTNYSEKYQTLVYSIENYKSEKLGNIYTFSIPEWKETNIGKGYSPTFIDDDIVYWTKEDEKIHLYNYKTGIDSVIFSVPDSLTMWLCGPDYCFPLKIRTKNTNNQNLIYLNFCSKIIKPGEDECGTEVKFLITRKGEIIDFE